MNALLDAALGYAAWGIPVYPVHWPRPPSGGAGRACSCPRGPWCDRPAKHPLVRHGVKQATTDTDRIGRWWRRWPQANVGLATGVVFDALDVDAPLGWPPCASSPARRACGSSARWWPRGAVARTPGFARPGWATAHPAAWRTWTGAAAVAACSPHPAATSRAAPTGGAAAWTRRRCPRCPPPCAPCWTPTRRPRPSQPARSTQPHPATRTAAGCWPPSWPPAPGHPGHRNHTLNRTAFKVYRYVAGGLLEEEDVTAAFTTAALAIGLEAAEVARTLASARAAGLANPRSIPTAADREANR